VHIEDRGFQLADSIYEVILLRNNKLIDINWHLERLFRSLNELEIKFDQGKEYLEKIILELFAKNNLTDGSVYLQITRGTANRQQIFPDNITTTITATVSPLKTLDNNILENGLTVQIHQDIRWQRCNIKSTSLLASCWIRDKAIKHGADDAILVRDEWESTQGVTQKVLHKNTQTYQSYVTEATFANVFIVDKFDTLITRNADNFILQGITRNRIIDLAKKNGIVVLEKKFTVEELLEAKEVFLSSTTLLIRPVTKIDQQIIGNGKAGEISKKLLNLYNNFINN
jgi:D-alanine transaminase